MNAHDHARRVLEALGHDPDVVPTFETDAGYLAYLGIVADLDIKTSRQEQLMRDVLLGPDPEPSDFDGLDEDGNDCTVTFSSRTVRDFRDLVGSFDPHWRDRELAEKYDGRDG